jgi:hypothetical protein
MRLLLTLTVRAMEGTGTLTVSTVRYVVTGVLRTVKAMVLGFDHKLLLVSHDTLE